MKFTARKALTTALVASSFLALSACGQNQDTVAVQMGDTAITMEEFAQTADEVDAIFGQGTQIPRDQILSNAIVAHYLMDAAPRYDLRVSDSDIEAVFGEGLPGGLGEASEATKNMLRIQLLAQIEGANPALMDWQQEAVEALQADEISVNTRYGTYDPQTLTVAAPSSPWKVNK